MIRHLVFFRLKENLPEEEKEKQVRFLIDTFQPLRERLPFVLEYRVARNFSESPAAWDVVIDSVMKDKKDLKKYSLSPEHQEAIQQASGIEKEKAVVDFEL